MRQEGWLSPTERASVSAISLRHILASPGYAPGTIAVNVTWMEREFNAGQTHGSIYPYIFNRLRVIARYWSRRLSLMRVFVLSLCTKFEVRIGLPVRKIWRTSGLSISRPGDLDLWPMTLNLVCIIARGVDNLPTNFGLPRTFCSRLIGQHLSTYYVTLRPWPLTFWPQNSFTGYPCDGLPF